MTEGRVAAIQRAVERANQVAIGPTGGGLVAAATIDRRVSRALEDVAVDAEGERVRRRKRNAFGHLAGLRISRRNYDRGHDRFLASQCAGDSMGNRQESGDRGGTHDAPAQFCTSTSHKTIRGATP